MYNENGLRVQKTVNGVVTKYTLHGKNIVHMTQGSNELHFFYDAQNKPAVVVYNGTPYSYVKNLQGDIVALLDSTGTVVVSYVYDAWGRPISKTGSMAATLGTVQPFRYRGYVYDEETGLYYLRSRYFNPVMCKFINADMVLGMRGMLSHNLYCYCKNRPCQFYDPDGLEEEWYFPPELIWTYTPSPTASPTPCPTPRPNYVDGHYYMITPLSHSTGVYLGGESGDYSKLGATAYRYNQSSGLPEYYVGEYQDGYFFLYCESIYGRADAWDFEYVLETDVVAHRYGGLLLTQSAQTYCAYATVKNLQEDLMCRGYDIGGDQLGHYGPGTYGAVQRFQIDRGLEPDGRAGEETLPVLFHEVHYVGPVW